MTPPRRAPAMPPDDRRRAIVAAVVPLLGECGHDLTTRQIANAAGVAEGTIFRVFPDKNAVIVEAVRAALDPGPTLDRLAAIDPALSLEHQMGAAVEILVKRADEMMVFLGVLRAMVIAGEAPRPGGEPRHAGPPDFLLDAHAAVVGALTGFFRRQGDRIRLDPSRAALALNALATAGRHAMLTGGAGLSVDEIVDIAMYGIVEPAAHAAYEAAR